MKTIWNGIQLGLAAAGGFLSWYLGGLDGMIYALVVFVAADYLTGVMCAIADRKLSSEVGARGIFKKVVIFALVGVGHISSTHRYWVTQTAECWHGGDVLLPEQRRRLDLENAAHIGLPVPGSSRRCWNSCTDAATRRA